MANLKIDKAIDESCKKNIHLETTITKILTLYKYVFKLASCLLLMVASYTYLYGDLTELNFLIMLISSFIVFSSIEKLGDASAFIQMVDVSLDKIENLDIAELQIEGDHHLLGDQNDICFNEVTFAYEDEPVIKGLTLEVEEGQTVALIGSSGSGKSTLCHLLTRFWDVDQGSITIGGHDLRDLTYDGLMAKISIVFQQVYLFEDTILNNIRFACPSAPLDAVYAAAKKACCHEFIMALPSGYETMVKEGGKSLSGGQGQRIAIARAILKDAPIVVLDEATSSIDPVNEVLIHQGVMALTENKTVLIVAHQLATIKQADQIIVMDKGQIIEQGSHDTLMALDGLYKKFVSIRTSAYNWQL